MIDRLRNLKIVDLRKDADISRKVEKVGYVSLEVANGAGATWLLSQNLVSSALYFAVCGIALWTADHLSRNRIHMTRIR